MKSVSLALVIYSADHQDRLPLMETWMDATEIYRRNPGDLQLASERERKGRPDALGVAFFEGLSGKPVTDMAEPSKQVVSFESWLLGRNAHSNLSTLATNRRKEGRLALAFIDGHVRSVKPVEYPNQLGLAERRF